MVSGKVVERLWASSGGALHVVRWGEEIAAFHEATASTHIFDEDTARLLEVLQQGCVGVSSVVLWSTAYGVAPSASDCQALDETLETLVQAGLVTATTS